MNGFVAGALVALGISATPALAETFTAENKVVVTGVSDSLISVPSGGRFGARGAWCAAADYATDVLHAPGAARLYVQNPATSPSGAVVFGLTPGNTTPTRVTSTSAALRRAGSNLSINHAMQFCHDARLRRGR